MSRVAFLGLGVMGYPMAGHLATQGYDVAVYNRSPEKAEAWLGQHKGRAYPTPREACEGAQLVFTCVGNDDDLRSVVLGPDGALAGMSAGAILVDHTTTSAEVARELFALGQEGGVDMLDAPVSGGEAGAVNAALTIMVGGEATVFATAQPALMAYGRAARLMGPIGAGQLTKMVNQICIAGLLHGLSEGLAFAQKAGLDGRAVIDVISKGAAQSWQMENRFDTMIDDRFDFGFAVDWMVKDLGICLDEAERNGSELPITEIVKSYYGDVQEVGGGRWDTSSLITRLR